MNTKKTKANVLIYSLVLVNLALLLSLAMFNNFFVFLNNTERGNMDKKLSNNILYKGSLFAKYARKMNENGSGVIDLIGCPESVTMSGNTVTSTTNSSLTFTGGRMLCEGMHNGQSYYIYFNADFTDFSGAIYFNDALNVYGGSGARTFIDSDNTHIDFTAGLPLTPDGVDDNFNSDNYSISASGSTMFPGGYVDDDMLPRVTIYGYISPQSDYNSILWANTKTNNYIESNPNNSDSIYDRLGSVSGGKLYLDVDRDFDLKIIQLNKSSYNNTYELIADQVWETKNMEASLGYIQDNAGLLSLSSDMTGNELIFDFVANDYAILLNNIGGGVLTYILTGLNSSGSGIYLNPIDDSGEGSIKYLGSEILQDQDKNYIGKIFEVVHKK